MELLELSAMVIGNLTQAAEKKLNNKTTLSIYFEFAVMKTGSKDFSIGEG